MKITVCSERCADCRSFVADEGAKTTTLFKVPGDCTDSFGPDGLIEGDLDPKKNNSKILEVVDVATCFKPRV